MNIYRYRALIALTAAGVAWGTTVPLSKIALVWVAPGWLAFIRFGLAGAVLAVAVLRRAKRNPGYRQVLRAAFRLPVLRRAKRNPGYRQVLRAAFRLPVLGSGALGYGGSVVLQNAGIARTSVTHAALLAGAAPVLVAMIAFVWRRAVAPPVAWAGSAVSLAGVGVITGGHSGSATLAGDAIVLVSVVLMASATVVQSRFLEGLDPVALTLAQFTGAAAVTLPVAAATSGVPSVPAGAAAGTAVIVSVLGLAAGGTLLPFTLYAYGQRHVPSEVAGAFLNLEPFVGAIAGTLLFGDQAGPRQIAGGTAILVGIAMGSLPGLLRGRPAPAPVTVPVAAADGDPEPRSLAGPREALLDDQCRDCVAGAA